MKLVKVKFILALILCVVIIINIVVPSISFADNKGYISNDDYVIIDDAKSINEDNMNDIFNVDDLSTLNDYDKLDFSKGLQQNSLIYKYAALVNYLSSNANYALYYDFIIKYYSNVAGIPMTNVVALVKSNNNAQDDDRLIISKNGINYEVKKLVFGGFIGDKTVSKELSQKEIDDEVTNFNDKLNNKVQLFENSDLIKVRSIPFIVSNSVADRLIDDKDQSVKNYVFSYNGESIGENLFNGKNLNIKRNENVEGIYAIYKIKDRLVLIKLMDTNVNDSRVQLMLKYLLVSLSIMRKGGRSPYLYSNQINGDHITINNMVVSNNQGFFATKEFQQYFSTKNSNYSYLRANGIPSIPIMTDFLGNMIMNINVGSFNIGGKQSQKGSIYVLLIPFRINSFLYRVIDPAIHVNLYNSFVINEFIDLVKNISTQYKNDINLIVYYLSNTKASLGISYLKEYSQFLSGNNLDKLYSGIYSVNWKGKNQYDYPLIEANRGKFESFLNVNKFYNSIKLGEPKSDEYYKFISTLVISDLLKNSCNSVILLVLSTSNSDTSESSQVSSNPKLVVNTDQGILTIIRDIIYRGQFSAFSINLYNFVKSIYFGMYVNSADKIFRTPIGKFNPIKLLQDVIIRYLGFLILFLVLWLLLMVVIGKLSFGKFVFKQVYIILVIGVPLVILPALVDLTIEIPSRVLFNDYNRNVMYYDYYNYALNEGSNNLFMISTISSEGYVVFPIKLHKLVSGTDQSQIKFVKIPLKDFYKLFNLDAKEEDTFLTNFSREVSDLNSFDVTTYVDTTWVANLAKVLSEYKSLLALKNYKLRLGGTEFNFVDNFKKLSVVNESTKIVENSVFAEDGYKLYGLGYDEIRVNNMKNLNQYGFLNKVKQLYTNADYSFMLSSFSISDQLLSDIHKGVIVDLVNLNKGLFNDIDSELIDSENFKEEVLNAKAFMMIVSSLNQFFINTVSQGISLQVPVLNIGYLTGRLIVGKSKHIANWFELSQENIESTSDNKLIEKIGSVPMSVCFDESDILQALTLNEYPSINIISTVLFIIFMLVVSIYALLKYFVFVIIVVLLFIAIIYMFILIQKPFDSEVLKKISTIYLFIWVVHFVYIILWKIFMVGKNSQVPILNEMFANKYIVMLVFIIITLFMIYFVYTRILKFGISLAVTLAKEVSSEIASQASMLGSTLAGKLANSKLGQRLGLRNSLSQMSDRLLLNSAEFNAKSTIYKNLLDKQLSSKEMFNRLKLSKNDLNLKRNLNPLNLESTTTFAEKKLYLELRKLTKNYKDLKSQLKNKSINDMLKDIFDIDENNNIKFKDDIDKVYLPLVDIIKSSGRLSKLLLSRLGTKEHTEKVDNTSDEFNIESISESFKNFLSRYETDGIVKITTANIGDSKFARIKFADDDIVKKFLKYSVEVGLPVNYDETAKTIEVPVSNEETIQPILDGFKAYVASEFVSKKMFTKDNSLSEEEVDKKIRDSMLKVDDIKYINQVPRSFYENIFKQRFLERGFVEGKDFKYDESSNKLVLLNNELISGIDDIINKINSEFNSVISIDNNVLKLNGFTDETYSKLKSLEFVNGIRFDDNSKAILGNKEMIKRVFVGLSNSFELVKFLGNSLDSVRLDTIIKDFYHNYDLKVKDQQLANYLIKALQEYYISIGEKPDIEYYQQEDGSYVIKNVSDVALEGTGYDYIINTDMAEILKDNYKSNLVYDVKLKSKQIANFIKSKIKDIKIDEVDGEYIIRGIRAEQLAELELLGKKGVSIENKYVKFDDINEDQLIKLLPQVEELTEALGMSTNDIVVDYDTKSLYVSTKYIDKFKEMVKLTNDELNNVVEKINKPKYVIKVGADELQVVKSIFENEGIDISGNIVEVGDGYEISISNLANNKFNEIKSKLKLYNQINQLDDVVTEFEVDKQSSDILMRNSQFRRIAVARPDPVSGNIKIRLRKPSSKEDLLKILNLENVASYNIKSADEAYLVKYSDMISDEIKSVIDVKNSVKLDDGSLITYNINKGKAKYLLDNLTRFNTTQKFVIDLNNSKISSIDELANKLGVDLGLLTVYDDKVILDATPEMKDKITKLDVAYDEAVEIKGSDKFVDGLSSVVSSVIRTAKDSAVVLGGVTKEALSGISTVVKNQVLTSNYDFFKTIDYLDKSFRLKLPFEFVSNILSNMEINGKPLDPKKYTILSDNGEVLVRFEDEVSSVTFGSVISEITRMISEGSIIVPEDKYEVFAKEAEKKGVKENIDYVYDKSNNRIIGSSDKFAEFLDNMKSKLLETELQSVLSNNLHGKYIIDFVSAQDYYKEVFDENTKVIELPEILFGLVKNNDNSGILNKLKVVSLGNNKVGIVVDETTDENLIFKNLMNLLSNVIVYDGSEFYKILIEKKDNNTFMFRFSKVNSEKLSDEEKKLAITLAPVILTNLEGISFKYDIQTKAFRQIFGNDIKSGSYLQAILELIKGLSGDKSINTDNLLDIVSDTIKVYKDIPLKEKDKKGQRSQGKFGEIINRLSLRNKKGSEVSLDINIIISEFINLVKNIYGEDFTQVKAVLSKANSLLSNIQSNDNRSTLSIRQQQEYKILAMNFATFLKSVEKELKAFNFKTVLGNSIIEIKFDEAMVKELISIKLEFNAVTNDVAISCINTMKDYCVTLVPRIKEVYINVVKSKLQNILASNSSLDISILEAFITTFDKDIAKEIYSRELISDMNEMVKKIKQMKSNLSKLNYDNTDLTKKLDYNQADIIEVISSFVVEIFDIISHTLDIIVQSMQKFIV